MKHIYEFEEFQTGETYYHASNVINRKSIEEHGLDHTKGVSPWSDDDPEFPKGNYFWPTEKEAVRYALGLGDSFDIWAVNTSDLEEDPVTKGGFYTTEKILPNSIKFVRTIKGVNDESY